MECLRHFDGCGTERLAARLASAIDEEGQQDPIVLGQGMQRGLLSSVSVMRSESRAMRSWTAKSPGDQVRQGAGDLPLPLVDRRGQRGQV
jgi:hypothetical protein